MPKLSNEGGAIAPPPSLTNEEFAPVKAWLDQVIEKKMTKRELREALTPRLKEVEEEKAKAARRAPQEIAQEAGGGMTAPETSGELEEAARLLRKRAKELKSPEKILEERRKKAKTS